MITQKQICLKIDTELLEKLDAEVALGYKKRNTHINAAIRLYLCYINTRRRMRMINKRYHQEKTLEEFAREWFPEVYAW